MGASGMKYICLIYTEEKTLNAMSGPEVQAIAEECEAHCARLERSGHLLGSARLGGVETAATVRTRAGNTSITDGPFAETKEQLGGFYLIEAKDLNEALRIASEIPPGRLGCIEVRPLREG
jgi:hypothetical protein